MELIYYLSGGVWGVHPASTANIAACNFFFAIDDSTDSLRLGCAPTYPRVYAYIYTHVRKYTHVFVYLVRDYTA